MGRNVHKWMATAIEPRTYFADASVDPAVDPTEARYGRTLNKNQTTANQCVGALLTGRGDWTATELLLAGVQGCEAVVRRRMTGEMPAK
jgi:hypothetical protein